MQNDLIPPYQTGSPHIYIFARPSDLEDPDAKLAHLLILLSPCFPITVVLKGNSFIQNRNPIHFLKAHGIRYSLWEKLPKKLEGVALVLWDHSFFSSDLPYKAKERGLRVVWSNEMMCHQKEELQAIRAGAIDRVLYVSQSQQSVLAPGYGSLSSAMIGSYVEPGLFPFVERQNEVFTIGRLSNADPLMYSEDFPVFYHELDLPEVRFRVMAWNKELTRKYKWFAFDSRWEFLQTQAEPEARFLQTLDLFVCTLGHNYVGSWERSIVAAMLSGSIPLIQPEFNRTTLVANGESGFICTDIRDFQECGRMLFYDRKKRIQISRQCRNYAVQKLCDKSTHLELWKAALTF